ncbi:MAG: DNA topoisomerase IV subunit A [Propionibacteriaceae bacterium]|jgi:DNA gyrase subunit A|nr:DNA topoisomerase IV subunit A [Propionibacteriaceae bacterium]
MATKPTPPPDDFDEKIIDIEVSQEIEASYLEYAYSVIYARALPDARDGLKPVQRRILYAMDQMGVKPTTPHVKCARVVGQVMGVYHPHGDTAIYDALVRLAQEWSQRLPLIDGHGNFGSLDARAAAMRYTECRMGPPAAAMTADLDAEAVDFKPNYDGKEQEPVVLPAAFPNLLVNGAAGIAVGMATNMAPHNLVEVVAGLKHLLENPDATLDDVMRFVPGPDLPLGGKIIGLDGIREAYATGRGAFRMRAATRIEQVTPRRKGIVVTELPYQIGPEKIMEQIKALQEKKAIQGIADVKDLTDLANGTRLVIEVKNGINPEALLEQLFAKTKLEDSFSINAVALVDGQPRTLGLVELMCVFLDHRLDVTLRRARFHLRKAVDRLHLVHGLLTAILDIDDVIAIIRSSDDAAQARGRLIEAFDLDETQANYILDMQLRRLTKLSTLELEAERDELNRKIAELNAVIDSPTRLREVVARDLDEVGRQFGTPRRTVLLSGAGVVTAREKAATAAAPIEVPDGPTLVALSSAGLVARIDGAQVPADTGPRAGHDVVASSIQTTTRGELGALTSLGRVVRLAAIDLPSIPATADAANFQGGSPLAELVQLEPRERVLALTTLSDATFGWAFGTRRGVVKRTNPELIGKDAWDLIRLDSGDEVVGAVELHDDSLDFCFITSDAQLLRFPSASVRPQGRSGGGMAGVNLAHGATVVFFGAVDPATSDVVTVAGSSGALPGTDTGSVKVTPLDLYPAKGRATGGVRCQRFLKGEDTLLLAWAGPAPAVAAAASGSPITLPTPDSRRDMSGTPVPQPIAAIGTRKLVWRGGPGATPSA